MLLLQSIIKIDLLNPPKLKPLILNTGETGTRKRNNLKRKPEPYISTSGLNSPALYETYFPSFFPQSRASSWHCSGRDGLSSTCFPETCGWRKLRSRPTRKSKKQKAAKSSKKQLLGYQFHFPVPMPKNLVSQSSRTAHAIEILLFLRRKKKVPTPNPIL